VNIRQAARRRESAARRQVRWGGNRSP